MADSRGGKGVSLAKGPVGLLGLLALIYGITALIFGGSPSRRRDGSVVAHASGTTPESRETTRRQRVGEV